MQMRQNKRIFFVMWKWLKFIFNTWQCHLFSSIILSHDLVVPLTNLKQRFIFQGNLFFTRIQIRDVCHEYDLKKLTSSVTACISGSTAGGPGSCIRSARSPTSTVRLSKRRCWNVERCNVEYLQISKQHL